MSEKSGIVGGTPQNGEKSSSRTPVTTQDSGGSNREPRATRRTRNATRGWDDNGLPPRYLASKEDRTVSMASMILSRIDADSYEHAAWDDADYIMKNHILPKSLPWHKPRVPLLSSLPRDIEDMQGVWHAGDVGEDGGCSNHINNGYFGYGMYDMGGLLKEDVKGTRAETIIAKPSNPMVNAKPLSPSKRRLSVSSREDGSANDDQNEIPFQRSDQIDAAARRSEDPGIIELTVKLPLPSFTSCLLQCQRHNILPRDPWVKHNEKSRKIAKSILQGERAETCSSMPLYWSKIDKDGSYTYKEPPAFSDLATNDDGVEDEKSIYEIMQKREQRKRKIEQLSESCTRKWKVSVKVANVTSRSVLTRQESKPMWCAAVFPSYVQSGQSLTIESAEMKDKEGLRDALGSYDCRATAVNTAMSFEAMDNDDIKAGKDTGAGRAKRINVGRNRLIWSRAKMSVNKASFSSLLTGQKLDAMTYKRPKDAKVTIKINGKVLCDVAEQDGDQKRTSVGNFFTQKTSWSSIKVNKSINAVCGEEEAEAESHKLDDVKDETKESPARARCTFDPDEYLNTLVKNIKNQGNKGNQQDDHTDNGTVLIIDGNIIPSYRRPKFSSLPLDDGFLRTHCELPGSLQGSSRLPKVLANVAASSSLDRNDGPSCTVCWEKSEGSGPLQVLKCIRCGLLAHRDCCLDPGKYDENKLIWECAVCKVVPCKEILPKISETLITNEPSTSHHSQSHSFDNSINGSRKSRRKPRTPTRFKETDADEKKSSTYTTNSDFENFTSIPKCTLCPHSGGAMSMTINEGNGDDRRQRWTHEVCRIWCTKQRGEQKEDKAQRSHQSQSALSHPKGSEAVCCICGMGRIHNAGQEKEEVLQLQFPQDANGITIPGLTKCAATSCNVHFHPMCALLYTKLSKNYIDSGSNPHKKPLSDKVHCQQFSLELLDVVQRDGEDDVHSYVVPVGFCGLHNIKRREEYGCLPCEDEETKVLFDSMRIPYQDG